MIHKQERYEINKQRYGISFKNRQCSIEYKTPYKKELYKRQKIIQWIKLDKLSLDD